MVESAKTATVSRLDASTVRIDSTASDDSVKGSPSGMRRAMPKAISRVSTATSEKASGRNHMRWTTCLNLNAI
ncbi:hypothetical protein D3C87_1569240 [compost metagenome]